MKYLLMLSTPRVALDMGYTNINYTLFLPLEELKVYQGRYILL